MRGIRTRDNKKVVQSALIDGIHGQEQVPVVEWIEGAAEKADSFEFLFCISHCFRGLFTDEKGFVNVQGKSLILDKPPHSSMKIIVTAGPSYEPIDEVRRMTNFSTGHLGTQLARELAESGHEVILLLGQMATCSLEGLDKSETLEVVRFGTAQDLLGQMTRLAGLARAVFHVAAVGDWQVASTRDASGHLLNDGKIPTHHAKIFLELEPTVKILGQLRGLYPQAWIVGWKYEVEGGREGLLEKGSAQIARDKIDGCVLNGPAWGSGFGLLIPGVNQLEEMKDSEELYHSLKRRLPE